MNTIMKPTTAIKYILFLLTLALLASCTDNPGGNDDEGPGEEELITRVTLTLTAEDDSQTSASWSDEDGPGGNEPVIGTLQLQAGVTYSGTIQLLDTTDEPAGDITAEVEEEAEEHQLFYSAEGGIAGRVTVTVTDTDSNGLPVGLTYRVEVIGDAAATGTLNVVLSHYDEVPKDGTTRSDETDVDIDIPVVITAAD